MNHPEIISLFIATIIFVASPGPGVFAIISSSLNERFSINLSLCLGLISGDLIYLTLAMLGMSKIILLWGDFFFYLQLFGGTYLIFLGLNLSFSKPELIGDSPVSVARKSSLYQQFFTAILISLSNPKTILFYLGFLPAFINLQNLNFIKAVQIVLIIFLAAILVCLVYIFASHSLKKILSSNRKTTYFNWISGGLIALVGCYLLSRAFGVAF